MILMQQVCVLGATGSIGISTLDVIERHSDRYQTFALAAYSNAEKLFSLCQKHRPRYAVLAAEWAATDFQARLNASDLDTELLVGASALVSVAEHEEVDIVMAAIVGAAGLQPNLAAIKKGKKVLLANKESLVMSGALFMNEARKSGATLLPIDSEHNAIYQALPDNYRCGQRVGADIKRLLLTASGGPFRGFSLEQLNLVTPEQACAHPNWSMGPKISVDSASLMNKGLELIEACWLFDVQSSRVDVHIHPQSIVHSMVEYTDGSVIAQLGQPDMRTPIAYGLAWPERIDAGVSSLDLFTHNRLDFEAPDVERFPCLTLAKEAFDAGGSACTVLNAANEVAVEAFLKGNISFVSIPDIIREALDVSDIVALNHIDDVLVADQAARRAAASALTQLS